MSVAIFIAGLSLGLILGICIAAIFEDEIYD